MMDFEELMTALRKGQLKDGSHVELSGVMAIGELNRIYVSEQDAESKSEAHLTIANAAAVEGALMDSVPPYSGGNYLFHDNATVSGTLETTGTNVSLLLNSVVVHRGSDSYKVRID